MTEQPGAPQDAARAAGVPSATAAGSGAAASPTAVPPAVAAALDRLETLEGRPVAEHVEVFDAVHRHLQDALATLDEA